MAEEHDRSQDSAGLSALTRLIANAIPPLIAQLATSSPGRSIATPSSSSSVLCWRHALELTGGNQLQAARLLGLNRNAPSESAAGSAPPHIAASIAANARRPDRDAHRLDPKSSPLGAAGAVLWLAAP